MKNFFTLFIILLFVQLRLVGQTYIIPSNKLFNTILNSKTPITYIPPISQNLLPVDSVYSALKQQIIYNEKGLFIIIDGTGLVFKSTHYNQEKIEFTRQDATSFFGYNTGSLKLMPNDTLFSFGGYGFWHFNGYLSYFDTQRKEWEILLLNKEVPFWNKEDELSSIFFISNNQNFVYYTQERMKQHGIRYHSELTDSIYLLNLEKREISTEGFILINKKEIGQYAKARKIITPFGVLYDNPFDQNKDYLIDFKNNKILTGYDTYIQKIISSKNNYNEHILFYRNGYIYSACYPFSSVDSIPISLSNFNNNGTPLYRKMDKYEIATITILSKIVIVAICILLLVLLVFIKYKKRSNSQIIPKKELNEETLSSLEIVLLNQLIDRLYKNEFCTVDELNNLLGVSNKSVEIKKKARTDFITKINYKIKQELSLDYDLIKRLRSENDKRSYLYFIEKADLAVIKKYLKLKSTLY